MTKKHKTEKELKPLIDCDLLVYRCGFAADSQIKKEFKAKHPDASDEELKEHIASLDYTGLALQNAKTVIESVTDRFSAEYKAYIHGKGNFRDRIATIKPYKGNRDKVGKPKYYNELREYLIERWHAQPAMDQEADDLIGIEQFDNPDKYTVIVSTDKDMDQIPGWHFNWVKSELYYQPITEANLFFFWQMMVGDSVDNIPGIDGVGVKTATKIINEQDRKLERVREVVKDLYRRQYGDAWDKAYWEVGQLLYIRRRPMEECPLL